MAKKRQIEIFSAGCPACEKTIAMVNDIACPSCEVHILDMNEPKVASRAETLGIMSVPAVVIDGDLAGRELHQVIHEGDLHISTQRFTPHGYVQQVKQIEACVWQR